MGETSYFNLKSLYSNSKLPKQVGNPKRNSRNGGISETKSVRKKALSIPLMVYTP